MGAPHGGHGTPFRDKNGRYWYTMFGNDPTAPWRMKFGLVPIDIGDAASIGVPRVGAGKDGLEWLRVKSILVKVANDKPVTLVVYEQFVRAPGA